MGGNNALVLVDGKQDARPTCYSGAIRIQALPPNTQVFGRQKASDEILFGLEVAPEPRIQWRNTISVQIDKAIDENQQKLSQAQADATSPNGGIGAAPAMAKMIARPIYLGSQRQVPVRLKAGAKPSKMLKELVGHVSAQVQTAPEALMTVENILKAADKTVKGAEGGSLKVLEVERQENGQIKIRVQLENPPNIVPGAPLGLPVGGFGVAAPGGVAIAVAGPAVAAAAAPAAPAAVAARPAIIVAYDGGYMGLSLVDDKGQSFQLVGVSSSVRILGGTVTRESTLTYQPQKGQGDPSKLIFSGSRIVTVDVPFTLKDVPLP